MATPSSALHVAPEFQPIFRELGIDADQIFRHPLIVPLRKQAERETCTLDATLHDGNKIRWHVKRYPSAEGVTSRAEDAVTGHRALMAEKIPTATLVAYGTSDDRRSFVIFEDLAGYENAERLVQSAVPFDRILAPTADIAGKLHGAGLHHCELYLRHFFAKVDGDSVNVRLIDTARVKRLPGIFTRGRCVATDLAQFWYSTIRLPITDQQRLAWLQRYAEQRGFASVIPLHNRVLRKVAWIAKQETRESPRTKSQ